MRRVLYWLMLAGGVLVVTGYLFNIITGGVPSSEDLVLVRIGFYLGTLVGLACGGMLLFLGLRGIRKVKSIEENRHETG